MALNQLHDETSGPIKSVFEQVVREGLDPGSVTGAADSDIDRFAAAQGVVCVPEAVREVLRLVGRRPGIWFAGTAFGVDSVGAGTKRQVVALLSDVDHELRDPAGMLVLAAHQGYSYHVIDGADLALEDPPVWEVEEPDEVYQGWSSVSAWFDGTKPSVSEYRAHLAAREMLGLRRLPE
ncbi:SMI1/KNR4 family protein [Nocardia sp. NPDC057030]|uniref:SMI1/KNR4 family protein n=1 Tax=unclassified Nocardia TaxID=2637762 RepID=UPI003631355B